MISCTNPHHDVTDLVNHGMVKNTGTWISWEQIITFLRNKKFVLNQCLRWNILRIYRFVAEVTFDDILFVTPTHNISARRRKAPVFFHSILLSLEKRFEGFPEIEVVLSGYIVVIVSKFCFRFKRVQANWFAFIPLCKYQKTEAFLMFLGVK